MNITGYLASVLIGISLGLIGGGGSILTMPVLVYLFRLDVAAATVYSLFVVGSASTAGSLSYFRKGLVSLRTALLFGIPSITGVYLTRRYLVPAIPQQIFSIGQFTITRSMLLMVLFAVLMILAARSMIRKQQQAKENANVLLMIVQGTFIGMLTGLVGAGGGFLIIPALVNLLGMPMKKAVGTSLVVIAINSLAGFLFSAEGLVIQWKLLLSITVIAVAGILIGSWLAGRINGSKLKPGFGWFILVMGVYIILRETVFK
ncbi:sulfite exporter TauE/SafE family protein [Sediminibacterium ginsengisoli]|uniref:Probable membrane transporter protein n=1 Tax=Sediminibacterium ginsengisoli TaxID=413434 RepID=A0A1T4KTX3_9BACT|nr:sulfite exporter TauE/SafE family protein [Sediminibacterium ginsengisoli]SJZ45881.1 hypothetical protein SAMN04488132_102112 [Sediminibacterium ginsengisoli]